MKVPNAGFDVGENDFWGEKFPRFQPWFLGRPEILAGGLFLPAVPAAGCAGADAPRCFDFQFFPAFVSEQGCKMGSN